MSVGLICPISCGVEWVGMAMSDEVATDNLCSVVIVSGSSGGGVMDSIVWSWVDSSVPSGCGPCGGAMVDVWSS